MNLDFDPYAARGSRTPCPDCGRIGTMTIWTGMQTSGFDDAGKIIFSLAGYQAKFPAYQVYFIQCGGFDVEGCGWKMRGLFEGSHFVVVPVDTSTDRAGREAL